MQVLQEITPLQSDRLYMSWYYWQNQLDFPVHYHEDYELNLTAGVRGQRIVGPFVEEISDCDLALMFPDVIHCYKRAEGETCQHSEVTVVQFSKDLPSWRIMSTVQMEKVRDMLSRPVSGLKFSQRVARSLKERIESLAGASDFAAGIRFLEILDYLANVPAEDVQIIGSESDEIKFSRSRRIKKIIKFTEENYQRKITLEDVGLVLGMSPASACRFFKKRTGHNYWDFLVGYRLECVERMLTHSEMNISEIAYSCGFNALSHFNKVFRERTGYTPKDYRERYKHSVTRPE